MMSVSCEKISNNKRGFLERVIDCFERYPKRLQLLFLGDTDKQYCHFGCFNIRSDFRRQGKGKPLMKTLRLHKTVIERSQ